jgi:hypothetical protein
MSNKHVERQADKFLKSLSPEPVIMETSRMKEDKAVEVNEVAVRLECLRLANTAMPVSGEEGVIARAERFTRWVTTGCK